MKNRHPQTTPTNAKQTYATPPTDFNIDPHTSTEQLIGKV